MSEKLKPCPFCGGEVKEFTGEDAAPYRWTVECDNCGAHVGSYTRHNARVKWNRRVGRTCRMDAPIDGEYRCSECGHLNRETYRADKGWYPPKYCAHCGARAVGCDDA